MAFSRHNIEKRRLIELVRLNPILWDCRLPHYKRSDKKKAIKWNELGRMFNVNGERVQRTFTSLREIFRRELNHEKMLGTTRFKSKWEYYDAMAFLKEVIRERKSRERIKNSAMESNPSNNNNNSNNVTSNNNNNNNNNASNISNNNNNNNSNSNNNNNNNNSISHDEYQYFAPSDPNNPNNQQQPNKSSIPSASPVIQPVILPSISQLPVGLQQQAQHLQALQLQPDVTLTSLQKTTPTIVLPLAVAAVPPAPAATLPGHVQLCSSSRSCSSSPSIYIKDEPDSQDEASSRSAVRKSSRKLVTIRAQTKQQLKASLQAAPKVGGGAELYATPSPHLIINTNNELIDVDAGDLDDDDDDLEYDDDDDDDNDTDNDALRRQAAQCPPNIAVDMLGTAGRLSPGSSFTAVGGASARHQPSPRELLYIKFGDFLAARLNTLHETVANELMNKILLLIAEK
ncbi:myosin-G heavy chain [Drosophila grimshawi]|uniref:GH16779 n=1 Tax=Drosophila grimshawi TaxID=7222 RepID=B4J3S4_DROGR|nr:myosin-G heavy chain [Drosophila grimshawi]XP_032595105.1 myosin-G heavy chain [Drosophila grimshawi]EDV97305.1 GH16779 [Drosophila grimshawi]